MHFMWEEMHGSGQILSIHALYINGLFYGAFSSSQGIGIKKEEQGGRTE